MGARISSQEQSDLEALINLRDISRQIEITKKATSIYEKRTKTAVLWFSGSIGLLVVLIVILCLAKLPRKYIVWTAGFLLLFVITCGIVWFSFHKKVGFLKKHLLSLELARTEISRDLGV